MLLLMRKLCLSMFNTLQVGSSITPSGPTLPPISIKCANAVDIVFVLDVSGSIEQPNFSNTLAFVVNIIENLSIDDGTVQVGSKMKNIDLWGIVKLLPPAVRAVMMLAAVMVTALQSLHYGNCVIVMPCM